RTGIDAVEHVPAFVPRGAGEILLTSIDRASTGLGFHLVLTRALSDAGPVPVIASGGVGHLDHLSAGGLDRVASPVIAASIFHFGTYTIAEAKARMAAAGIPVREVAYSRVTAARII